MTDYKQLYEQMKEKQTTTFAMMMKVMEENEALKEENEYLEETNIASLKCVMKRGNEIKELKEELQTAIIECDRFEGENEGLRENIMRLEEILEENGLLD